MKRSIFNTSQKVPAICQPMFMILRIQDLFNSSSYVLGQAFSLLTPLCIGCSCIILIIVNVDRVIAVAFPIRRKTMNLRKKYILMMVIFCMVFAAVLLWKSFDDRANIAKLAAIVMAFVLSSIIICGFCNIYVYFKIRHEQKKVCINNAHQISRQVLLRKNKRTARTVLIITLSFYLCFVPKFLATLAIIFSKNDFNVVYHSINWSILFLFLNSSLNPYIYSCRTEKIRFRLEENVKKLRKKLFSRNNEEE